MKRKKYLIVTEKPSMVASIKRVYEGMENNAQFDADFASVNCRVENVNAGILRPEDLAEFKPFTLKGMKVPENFKIYAHGEYQIKCGEEIKSLLRENKYDAIINACDLDDEGNFEFQYVLESLGLERYKTGKIYMFALTDSVIESELMTLNEL